MPRRSVPGVALSLSHGLPVHILTLVHYHWSLIYRLGCEATGSRRIERVGGCSVGFPGIASALPTDGR